RHRRASVGGRSRRQTEAPRGGSQRSEPVHRSERLSRDCRQHVEGARRANRRGALDATPVMSERRGRTLSRSRRRVCAESSRYLRCGTARTCCWSSCAAASLGPYNEAGNLRRGNARLLTVDLTSAALPKPRLTPSPDQPSIVRVPVYTDFRLHAITDPADAAAKEPIDMNRPARSAAFLAGNRPFLTRRLWGIASERRTSTTASSPRCAKPCSRTTAKRAPSGRRSSSSPPGIREQ